MPPNPEMAGSQEVLPGLYRIELPLPTSLGSVNVYLVPLTEGYMLVDCGMDTAPALDVLTQAIENIGIGWRDIRRIVLTHVHPDHMGLAPKLLQLTGAHLALHTQDKIFLDQLADLDTFRQWSADVMARAGTPPDWIEEVLSSSQEILLNFQSLAPDQFLSGGEVIPTALGDFEVLWTPGHSPGHVVLYCSARRLLIAGDLVLEHITPNISWHPEEDPLAQYLEALGSLESIEVDLILPSHGLPFSGHREWIRQTKLHHQERCESILEFLRPGPRPAHDLVAHLWPRYLSPQHYRFAIFEVLAHLEYLQRRGRVSFDKQTEVQSWSRMA